MKRQVIMLVVRILIDLNERLWFSQRVADLSSSKKTNFHRNVG